MPRLCSVCHSDRREQVDGALRAGGSYRKVAARFALGEDSVRRHRQNHLGPDVEPGLPKLPLPSMDPAVWQLKTQIDRLEHVLATTEAEHRRGMTALQREKDRRERDGLFRGGDGSLPKTYSHVRQALRHLDRALQEGTVDQRPEMRQAMAHLHRAEDYIVTAQRYA